MLALRYYEFGAEPSFLDLLHTNKDAENDVTITQMIIIL